MRLSYPLRPQVKTAMGRRINPMVEKLHFRGKISKVTPDGRSGIVTLESQVEGNNYAVISPKTAGRISLMNGRGSLSTGTKVEGDAIKGADALKALTVHGVE
jgi:hypothetical protein